MTIYTHTEAGGKVINEDYLIARAHPIEGAVYLCILADGQGGRSNAAAAARTACEAVWSFAAELTLDELMAEGTWVRALEHADRETISTGGSTALMALALGPRSAAGASCGDAKAYFCAAGSAELAEWTNRQHKNPPLGSGEVHAEPLQCSERATGRLLMATDGVWKYCGYEALQASFAWPASAVIERLRAATLQRMGQSLPDDFSLIVAEIG